MLRLASDFSEGRVSNQSKITKYDQVLQAKSEISGSTQAMGQVSPRETEWLRPEEQHKLHTVLLSLLLLILVRAFEVSNRSLSVTQILNILKKSISSSLKQTCLYPSVVGNPIAAGSLLSMH